jgi:DNA polymerase-3 subunit epsilon/exodeoxyribonuclease X
MKFGKHKGKTLTEVALADKGYLSWMLSNMENLDDDMKYSIGKALEG